jgi:hypothetical protein
MKDFLAANDKAKQRKFSELLDKTFSKKIHEPIPSGIISAGDGNFD